MAGGRDYRAMVTPTVLVAESYWLNMDIRIVDIYYIVSQAILDPPAYTGMLIIPGRWMSINLPGLTFCLSLRQC